MKTYVTIAILFINLIYPQIYEEINENSPDTAQIVKTPLLIQPVILTIEFYQNYLGKIKGSYCPMYPSCSEYGRQAITDKNIKGILMTFDRLHRCSHDLENYDIIIINGKMRYLDEPD